MKGVQHMWDSSGTIFQARPNSPILRIGVVVAALALGTACNKLGLGSGGSTAPSPVPAAGSTINYTAVGASDANGVGSSAECLFLTPCPNGMGYVPVTVRALTSQGFIVNNLNLGIPTTVIASDFASLGARFGRIIVGNMIDNEMPFVQSNATVVTIFAGVNEINTITSALGGGDGASDPNAYIDAQVRAFATDYTNLLAGIRLRAGSPHIVILNVPNSAGLPFLATASLAQRQAAQRAAVGMTKTAVNVLASSSVTIVDLMCDSRSYVSSNYSGDGLHPNDAGYAFISAEVVKAITASSYPAPQSSCTGMTIVP
jgi:lysophospholipase L1-like esterase